MSKLEGVSVTGLCIIAILGIVTTEAFAQTESEKYEGNPILDTGDESWESFSVFGSAVLLDKDDPDPACRYKMWYSGSNGSPYYSSTQYRIGYATSRDGIAWEKHPANPVLDIGPGSWDGVRVSCPTVILDTIDPDPFRRYKMWYHGYDGSLWRIGYATSPDGIMWTKHFANPVLEGSGGAWESTHTFGPTVILDTADPYNRYKMWYSGDSGHDGNNRIGYATSPDGAFWMKHPANPVIDTGPAGAWDHVYAHIPAVIFNGWQYEMWYCGVADNDPSYTRIGYATSPDGVVWTKYPDNPILDVGPGGTWDSADVSDPSVIFDGIGYRMWYTGSRRPDARVGYAVLYRIFSCKVGQGWNLISLPLEPVDNSPDAVLASVSDIYHSVWSYDPGAGWSTYAPGFPSDIQEMRSGKGYWIKMSESGTLTVQGIIPGETIIHLAGNSWNLVGYSSLQFRSAEECMDSVAGHINSVWVYGPHGSVIKRWYIYSPGIPGNLEVMKPGYGYLIEADQSCDWDINAP